MHLSRSSLACFLVWAGRRGLMDNFNVRNLIALVMNIAAPCALFLIINNTSRAILQQQIWTSLAITLTFAILYIGCYFWARRNTNSVSESAVIALTFAFPNSAAIAVSLLTTTYGHGAAVPGALSIAMGAVAISPVTLALLELDSQGEGDNDWGTNSCRWRCPLPTPSDYLGSRASLGACQHRHTHSRLCGEYSGSDWRRGGWWRLAPHRPHSLRAALYSKRSGSGHFFRKAYSSADVGFWHRSGNAGKPSTGTGHHANLCDPRRILRDRICQSFNTITEIASSGLIATYGLAIVTLPLWIFLLSRFM